MTVDVGIDLGTTNSVVAVSRRGQVEIIKNRGDVLTPSVVYCKKSTTNFTFRVGRSAKDLLADPNRALEVKSEFKRKMGQNAQYRFPAAGITMSPEDLSAEVLKELRRAVEERFKSLPVAAVITVPAMFELPQNEATAKAARLAGIAHPILLQEPVAAAISCGLETTETSARWLIYDFGGGTFDASLVAIRDGQLSVVKHAGDNYLGGADFDNAIVHKILLPRLVEAYDLSSLQPHNTEDVDSISRFARLKRVAEEIKIELSRMSEVTVDLDEHDLFKDDSGVGVELSLTVTRADLESLIKDGVATSLEITRKVIQDSGFNVSDVSCIVLVGGTTYIPYVREQVESLGIPISIDSDPMTVVGKGAAIYASTIPLPDALASQMSTAEPGAVKVSLEFERVTRQENPLIGGKVEAPAGVPIRDCLLTITREDQGFTSGNLQLEESGLFFTNVAMPTKGPGIFSLELRGPDQRRIPTEPAEFTILAGVNPGKATLPSGCQVALSDGNTHMLVPAGTILPAEAQHDLKTTRELKAGSTDRLSIPFLSGDSPVADHNLVGMCIYIPGQQVQRDLPRGSSVEINLTIDEAGVPQPRVYVERLDQEFVPETQGRSTTLQHEPPDVMSNRLTHLREKLQSLSEQIEEIGTPEQETALADLRRKIQTSEVEGHIEAWENGDDVAAGKARNILVQLRQRVDQLAADLEFPSMEAEFLEHRERLGDLEAELQKADLASQFQTLCTEGDTAISLRDATMLEGVNERLGRIRHQLLTSQPAYWMAIFRHLSNQEHALSVNPTIRRLFAEGRAAAVQFDLDALQSVCRQIFQEMPADQVSGIQRGAVISDLE
jgi:molecular chaperone DnaK